MDRRYGGGSDRKPTGPLAAYGRSTSNPLFVSLQLHASYRW